VLYDHFLTFHDEVEYIWGGNNWLHKLIFIVNRYIVEATLVGTAYGSWVARTLFDSRDVAETYAT
jgi:hypothetical protein